VSLKAQAIIIFRLSSIIHTVDIRKKIMKTTRRKKIKKKKK